jgi:hypothetical protein
MTDRPALINKTALAGRPVLRADQIRRYGAAVRSGQGRSTPKNRTMRATPPCGAAADLGHVEAQWKDEGLKG